MRLWPNRRPRARRPPLEVAPIRLEVAHEVRHVHEPRARPDSVRILWQTETQVFQAIWPDVTRPQELYVPPPFLPPGAPPVRLELIPDYPRTEYRERR